MPEIGLGIGRERGTHLGMTREWLYWYDENGNRYPTPQEVVVQQQQQLEQSHQQIQGLLDKLQERGIDPNTL